MKIQLSQNAPVEVFPFVTSLHREVVLRHLDDESQDIEMTPDEADEVANAIRTASVMARGSYRVTEAATVAAAASDAPKLAAFSARLKQLVEEFADGSLDPLTTAGVLIGAGIELSLRNNGTPRMLHEEFELTVRLIDEAIKQDFGCSKKRS